jgi:hypothetical protein
LYGSYSSSSSSKGALRVGGGTGGRGGAPRGASVDGRLGACWGGGGGTARGAVGGRGGMPWGIVGDRADVGSSVKALSSTLESLACDFKASLWVASGAMSVS